MILDRDSFNALETTSIFEIADILKLLQILLLLTFSQHACLKTLLQTTILTTTTRRLVNDAILVSMTSVLHILLHRTSKESLKTRMKQWFLLISDLGSLEQWQLKITLVYWVSSIQYNIENENTQAMANTRVYLQLQQRRVQRQM